MWVIHLGKWHFKRGIWLLFSLLARTNLPKVYKELVIDKRQLFTVKVLQLIVWLSDRWFFLQCNVDLGYPSTNNAKTRDLITAALSWYSWHVWISKRHLTVNYLWLFYAPNKGCDWLSKGTAAYWNALVIKTYARVLNAFCEVAVNSRRW